MNTDAYQWKRFWCAREGAYNLDPNGFLYQSEYFKDAVGFEKLAQEPCLILLGEPGIGKSFAVKDAASTQIEAEPNDRVFFFDLRSYGSEERLYNALFKSEDIERWFNGEYRLHLFLDSLDECLLRVDTVAAMLVEEFGKSDFPVERLMLRIACRTADFPKVLENGLADIWKRKIGVDKISIYELCPIQRVDVLNAAEAMGISASGFLTSRSNKYFC